MDTPGEPTMSSKRMLMSDTEPRADTPKTITIIDLLNSPPAAARPRSSSNASATSVSSATVDPYLYHVTLSYDGHADSDGDVEVTEEPAGVFATREEANKHAQQDALSLWSCYEDRTITKDKDGLVSVVVHGDEDPDARTKVEKRGCGEKTKGEATEAWVVVEEGKVLGVHLGKAGAEKAVGRRLLERKRGKMDGEGVRYFQEGEGLVGVRVKVGEDGTKVREEIIKVEKWDFQN